MSRQFSLEVGDFWIAWIACGAGEWGQRDLWGLTSRTAGFSYVNEMFLSFWFIQAKKIPWVSDDCKWVSSILRFGMLKQSHDYLWLLTSLSPLICAEASEIDPDEILVSYAQDCASAIPWL